MGPLHQAIVAVSSNSDAEANFQRAEALLRADGWFRGGSTPIATDPVDHSGCAAFLNGAFWLETPLERAAFTAYLKDIEQRLGRVRGQRGHGPQPMDLDLVVWDGVVVRAEFHTRDYVRLPVEEVIARFGLPLPMAGDRHRLRRLANASILMPCINISFYRSAMSVQIVKKWGNSPAVRLPLAIMEAAQLRLEQAVEVRAEAGRVIIEPAVPSYRLDELLAGITSDNRHTEQNFGAATGRELM